MTNRYDDMDHLLRCALGDTEPPDAGFLRQVEANMRKEQTMGSKKTIKRLAVLALAATLVLALGATAYAVANYTDFFEQIFGGPDAGEQTYEIPLDHWDEEGNSTSMEITVEGEPVDQEKAQALLGDKVAEAAKSITVGDYTCTVEDITWSENGVGALTYTIENPNGLPDVQMMNDVMGFYQWADDWVDVGDGKGRLENGPSIMPSGAVSTPITWESLVAAMMTVDSYNSLTSVTDTRLEGRTYFTLAVEEVQPEALDFYFFSKHTGNDIPLEEQLANQIPEEYRLTVPLPEPAEAVELTAEDGWTARVSPMGLEITAPGEYALENFPTSEMTIHYADGSEYVISGGEANMNNTIFGFVDESGVQRKVFNRLVDPAAVESVTLRGSVPSSVLYDEAGDPDTVDMDLTFTR